MEGRVVSVSIKTSYRHDPHISILLPNPSNCSWCVGHDLLCRIYEPSSEQIQQFSLKHYSTHT